MACHPGKESGENFRNRDSWTGKLENHPIQKSPIYFDNGRTIRMIAIRVEKGKVFDSRFAVQLKIRSNEWFKTVKVVAHLWDQFFYLFIFIILYIKFFVSKYTINCDEKNIFCNYY